MSDPIIPGIDDARAREILAHRHVPANLLLAQEWTAALMSRLFVRSSDKEGAPLRRSPRGKALWERIKTDDL